MIQDSINQMLGVAGLAGAYLKKERVEGIKSEIAQGEQFRNREIDEIVSGAKEKKEKGTFEKADEKQLNEDLESSKNAFNVNYANPYGAEYAITNNGKTNIYKDKLKGFFTPKEATRYAQESSSRINDKINRSRDELMSIKAKKESANKMIAGTSQSKDYSELFDFIKSTNNLSGAHKQARNMSQTRNILNKIERGE